MFESARKLTPLRQLGWGFLLAWVFCVFYTNATGEVGGEATGSPTFAESLFYAAFPLAASVITLVAIVIAEPRIGAPTDHRPLVIAAPVLTAASTPLMFTTVADPVAHAALFAIGSIATGVGSALLWVMWGEYYAVVPREESEMLAPASAVSAALVVLLVSAMDGWVAIAVATALPLLSGLCFRLVWTPEAHRVERALAKHGRTGHDATHRPLAGLGRTGFGILTVFAIVSIAGMGQTHWLEGAPLQAILLFSTLMMAVVALMAVSGPRRMSLFFLYRWMCPTLVIGFAAVILFGSGGGIATVAASLGGRFTFCLIAQIYFANYAAAGRATPAQASSLGWLFVHAGDLLGVVAWISLEPWVSSEPAAILWVSTLCIVALVVVTMMVMGETSAFLRVPERDAIEAVTSGKTGAIVGTDSEAGTDAVHTGANARCSNDTPLYPDGTDRRSEVVATEPAPNPANESAIEANLEARIAALAAEHRLTPRETEVFALLSQGRSIPYIRDELIISRETAATHAKHIYAKLGVHSRQELIDLVQR